MRPTGPFPRGALLGVGGIFGVGLIALSTPLAPEVDAGPLEPIVAVAPHDFEVHVLGRGDTFGALLATIRLDGNERQRVLSVFEERASVRRLQPGTEIILRKDRREGDLLGLDVAINRDETVRLHNDRDFGWSSEIVETPVAVDTVSTVGAIESVLWTAVMQDDRLGSMDRDARIRLIDQLDRIFQWKIDFTRQIRPGDLYRVVYERHIRPDGSLRSGTVLAAEIVNQGREVVAIHFDPDGDGSGTWYDLDGNSLRRSFLRRPVEFSRITSRVSTARFHPVLNRVRAHNGVDFAAPTGTPVYATADGVVSFRGVSGGYGNMVEIRHTNGFITRYAHLSRFAAGLRVGSRVRQEEVIGAVGMTGLATGPHVHYELHLNGRILDPLSMDLPAGDPVPTDAGEEWARQRDAHLRLLQALPRTPPLRVAARDGAIGESRGMEEGVLP